MFSTILGIDESFILPDGNDYGPMKHNEIRKFKIDQNRYKDCKISSLKIKKEERSETEIKFVAVEIATDTHNVNTKTYKVKLICKSGEITALETARNMMKHARKCGIGTMLIRLCFNELRIHNVKNNINNAAVALIKQYSQINQVTHTHLNARKLEKWVKSSCEKAVRMTVTCDPKSDASAFFSSAIASEYTEMFFVLHDKFYPKDGRGLVQDLMKRYTDDGNILESDGTNNKVKVWGEIWVFCKSKISDKPN